MGTDDLLLFSESVFEDGLVVEPGDMLLALSYKLYSNAMGYQITLNVEGNCDVMIRIDKDKSAIQTFMTRNSDQMSHTFNVVLDKLNRTLYAHVLNTGDMTWQGRISLLAQSWRKPDVIELLARVVE
jgi:hypothetical protein